METYDYPENDYNTYIRIICIKRVMNSMLIMFLAGWLKSIGSQILYELDHRKPVLYVIPAENILGKLPLVPVGDAGTIQHHLCNLFPGAPGDRRSGAGNR
jgi:hypothetical protein